MKKTSIPILFLVILLCFLITACSEQNTISGSLSPTDSSGTTAATGTTEDAKMEALILEKLQGHHSIDIVLNAHKSREEWNTTLDRMIAKGAVLSEEEKTLIIDWLVARNTP